MMPPFETPRDPLATRWLNAFLAFVLLVLASPLLCLVALLIRLDSKGPVLFFQSRIGLRGRSFRMVKFRSMRTDAEALRTEVVSSSDCTDSVRFKDVADPRITRIGRVLRRFSIDELPQLWNVLVGDMNLVGPRPALPEEVALYTEREHRRLDVTPGLTCLWQVQGRADIPFEGQVRLDLEYIRRRSLALDLLILFSTIPAVLGGRGAY